ncbi:glycerol-3-phosphate dehydrogenase [Georgenia ruanii]|uniref:Glycerol-3-phosphate dehydrogenase n=1 Tax=Georgenia ruanii TaxID=348442 RepID=A0A7J9UYF0_9MICO|nr:glycerol-3-phosphate dehydrogenase [Georgenia ruanii]MPV89646.1 glycerol-3-phosphate dehydrogenase [Georgenia ruanii]
MARLDTRREQLSDHYDLAVVGAGINGLAIAREAAMRGLSVLLVERDDLGARTSSISTRLIHGGLKYLERLDFRLVMESIRERKVLLQQAPHLVHEYPMLIPFYRGNSRPGWLIACGVLLHDLLSVGKPLALNRPVGRRAIARRWPGLNRRGIAWGVLFADANVPWTERLCVELAVSASDHGAHVLTHSEVVELTVDGGGVSGVTIRDAETGAVRTARADVVVNAAGPWVDAVLRGTDVGKRYVGPTKGSHVVVDPFPGAPSTCVFFEARADKRPMFVLPWEGRYMIGTTDLPYDGSIEEIVASDEEVAYLIGEANALIPGAGLRPGDVLWSYSGVRPLPYVGDLEDPSKVTRDHQIVGHDGAYRGLFSVIGGKLTTHRALGEQAVDKVVAFLGRGATASPTASAPLPGAARTGRSAGASFARVFLARSPLDSATARRLVSVYGTRAALVERLIVATPELGAVIDRESGAVAAEVVFAVEQEGARTLEDVLLRRILVGLNADVGLAAAPAAAEVARAHLGWSEARVAEELRDYVRATRRFRPRAAAPGHYEDLTTDAGVAR